jgi:hypothetical protein
MIPALDNSDVERGLEAYLTAYFTAEAITVRQANAEVAESFAVIAPPVQRGLGISPEAVRSSAVAIVCSDAPDQMPGVYGGEDFEVLLIVVTPALIPGIGEADHSALWKAVRAAFPNSPGPGPDYAAWEVVHNGINTHLEAATGFRLQGYTAANGLSGKTETRIEQTLKFKPGMIWPGLLA